MVKGRQRETWLHTSEVLAMIANTVRNSKKRRKPYLGKDFNPWTRGQRNVSAESRSTIQSVIDAYGLRRNQRRDATP